MNPCPTWDLHRSGGAEAPPGGDFRIPGLVSLSPSGRDKLGLYLRRPAGAPRPSTSPDFLAVAEERAHETHCLRICACGV